MCVGATGLCKCCSYLGSEKFKQETGQFFLAWSFVHRCRFLGLREIFLGGCANKKIWWKSNHDLMILCYFQLLRKRSACRSDSFDHEFWLAGFPWGELRSIHKREAVWERSRTPRSQLQSSFSLLCGIGSLHLSRGVGLTRFAQKNLGGLSGRISGVKEVNGVFFSPNKCFFWRIRWQRCIWGIRYCM